MWAALHTATYDTILNLSLGEGSREPAVAHDSWLLSKEAGRVVLSTAKRLLIGEAGTLTTELKSANDRVAQLERQFLDAEETICNLKAEKLATLRDVERLSDEGLIIGEKSQQTSAGAGDQAG
ncbi:hypothetical protein PF004_g18877 [Phytophthora fragariae]|uniref:Uncharacterized protein n=1 Tax=Phytophthora fragariae TaxID=53985 RepID=A0A6G0NB95_9STRA|nr:hypothetical protein PF004_g18877 [Phytophthora fragariae]